jgi:hypothetical protein
VVTVPVEDFAAVSIGVPRAHLVQRDDGVGVSLALGDRRRARADAGSRGPSPLLPGALLPCER